MDILPYGTKFDVSAWGTSGLGISLAAKNPDEIDPDICVWIGGHDCRQTYHASLLNISAMSFGALSSHAILALNGGARLGHFAHNTGEEASAVIMCNTAVI